MANHFGHLYFNSKLILKPLFAIWEFSARHPGIIAVLIAVAGEVACDWNETTGRRAKLKKFFMALLVVGLAYELVEAAKTDKDAADAIERAANAEIKVTGLNLRVEELRKANDELEAKLQDRRITPEQMDKFVILSSKIRKIPIKIWVPTEGRDTETFANELRIMLSRAGFPTNSDAGMWGINREPMYLAKRIGMNFETPSLVFLQYGTNETYNTKTIVGERATNGIVMPLIDNTDVEQIYGGIKWCLDQIGIKSIWQPTPVGVNPGECFILVPFK